MSSFWGAIKTAKRSKVDVLIKVFNGCDPFMICTSTSFSGSMNEGIIAFLMASQCSSFLQVLMMLLALIEYIKCGSVRKGAMLNWNNLNETCQKK